MKKLMYLLMLLASAGTIYFAYDKASSGSQMYLDYAKTSGKKIWSNIEANPVPVLIAVGTFVLTFLFHKAKGRTFREAVEVAATRLVPVVPAPVVTVQALPEPKPEPKPELEIKPEPENLVLKRAQARTTRTQLLADQIAIKLRVNKLPNEIAFAEKDYCFAEKAVKDAKLILGEKHKVRNGAQKKLEQLNTQLETGEAEIDAIEAELKKLEEYI